MKQVIVIRKDLKLGAGKAAAQAAHASLSAYKKASKDVQVAWESFGQPKIVLKCDSEEQLIDIFMQAKNQNMPTALITDAGKTQIAPGTKTAICIGPAEDEEIDPFTNNLKLYS